jgi:hypothetical protein
MPGWEEAWRQLEGALSTGENISAVRLAAYLVLGGVLALYVRLLYRRCTSGVADPDSITRVFPILTIVTTGVIAVVKSSLALSLGLVGALSIVRFRAAIKEPEELVYLFLCIAIGLALGAEQPLLAIAVVGVATLFIVGMYLAGRRAAGENLLLTITGDSDQCFGKDRSSVWSVVEEVAGPCSLQRLDVQNGRAQVRMVVRRASVREMTAMVAQLRERLPDCEMSYVNLSSML